MVEFKDVMDEAMEIATDETNGVSAKAIAVGALAVWGAVDLTVKGTKAFNKYVIKPAKAKVKSIKESKVKELEPAEETESTKE